MNITPRRLIAIAALCAGLATPAFADDLIYFEENGGAGPRGGKSICGTFSWPPLPVWR